MFGKWRRKARDEPDALMWLTDRDAITRHQVFEHVLAVGASGSGKTSSLAHLMLGMMRAGFGFLILPAKGDDLHLIRRLACEAGRESDLRVFAPGSGFRFDFLNHEIESPGGIEAAAQLMTDLGDVASRSSSANSRDPFWPQAAARQIRMAMYAVHWAFGSCSAQDVFRFITSLPYSPEQQGTPEWNNGFCAKTFEAAKSREGWEENDDLILAADYALAEFCRVGEKTSAGISATSLNLLSKFIHGDIRSLVAGPTTLSPDDVLRGRIVVVNTPPLVYRESGRFAQLVWKLAFLRSVLRREVNDSTIPVALWQDEFQLHCVPAIDSAAQAVARSQLLSVVAATQNFPLLHKALESEEDAQALIGNFGTKLLFSNSCPISNALFSRMCGNSKHLFMSGSAPTGSYDLVGDWFGVEPKETGSAGFSEQWHPDVPPETFTALRKGGPSNGYVVEGVAFQGGRLFSNNKTAIRFAIQQRVQS